MAHRTLLPAIDEDVTRRGVLDAHFGTAPSVPTRPSVRPPCRALDDREAGKLSRQRGNKVG